MKSFALHAIGLQLLCLCISPTTYAQQVLPSDIRGVAVIGDSLSDGDPTPFDASPASTYDHGWVEYLAEKRALDFGPEVGGRKRGFNVAKNSAVSQDILRPDVAMGVPSQAERVKEFVRQGEVDVVIFLIGHNNINLTSVLNHAATDRLDEFDRGNINAVANDVATAWQTILSGAGLNSELTPPREIKPPKLIVVGIADVTYTPWIQRMLANPNSGWTADSPQRVRNVVGAINSSLRHFALDINHATYLDLPAMQARLNAIENYQVGGVPIRKLEEHPTDPTYTFRDFVHPRAVGNGIIANLVLDGINRTTGLNSPMLTDREILIGAGIGDRFVRVTLPAEIYFGDYTTVYQAP